jgi:hypothetical protein
MTFLLFSLVMRKFEQEMTEQRLNKYMNGDASAGPLSRICISELTATAYCLWHSIHGVLPQ